MPELKNPLIIPILKILKAKTQPIGEHELLSQLERQGDFDGGLTQDLAYSEARDLALFQRHFLIMNALYELQDSLAAEQLNLHISPLAIELRRMTRCEAYELDELKEPPELKAYYADLNNLQQTNEQDVESLLKGFWQRYLAADNRVLAYEQMELPLGASWQEVKLAYRRLAKLHHPDHGGDQQRFIELRAAYEVLEQLLV